MELSYNSKIYVPQAYAYKCATDFDLFESEGFGKLSKFEPRSEIRAPEIGARWRTSAEFQGRPRNFSLQLLELDGPGKLVLGNKSEKYDIEAHFNFDEVGAEETDFSFRLVAKAQSITAKLILQTIQLARARIESSMRADFEAMAMRMEDTFQG